MSTISQLEKDLQTTKYIIDFREERIDKLKRKPTLSEREKVFLGEEEELLKALKRLDTSYQNGLDIELGKLPPQSIEMEEAVIGAVLLQSEPLRDKDGNQIAPPAIHKVPFLRVEHFYAVRHQLIFKACRSVLLAGKGTDLRSVVHCLRSSGEIDIVGGLSYVAELIGKVSSASTVEINGRIIVELAIKRKLIEMAGMIMAEGYKDTKDCFELLEFCKQEFKIAEEWTNQ
jgi:replicative DNA helicase